MGAEKMSAIDSLLAQLDQPDHTHVWSHDDVLNARAELSALRAENARMREALTNLIDRIDEHSCDDYGSAEDLDQAMADASAALGGRDD